MEISLNNYKLYIRTDDHKYIEDDWFDKTMFDDLFESELAANYLEEEDIERLQTLVGKGYWFKGRINHPMMFNSEDRCINNDCTYTYSGDLENDVDEAVGRLWYTIQQEEEQYWNYVYDGDMSEFDDGWNDYDTSMWFY